jgi:ribosomal protein L32
MLILRIYHFNARQKIKVAWFTGHQQPYVSIWESRYAVVPNSNILSRCKKYRLRPYQRRAARQPGIVPGKRRQMQETKIRQTSAPCVKCGSYYRRGTKCNICGTENAEAVEIRDEAVTRGYHIGERRCNRNNKKYRY